MTRYELLKLNETMLTALLHNRISPKEVMNIEVYEMYKEMLAKNHKITYIVTHLGEVFGLKERAIYTLIRRFEQRVEI